MSRLDCRTCGACCTERLSNNPEFASGWIGLSEEDLSMLPRPFIMKSVAITDSTGWAKAFIQAVPSGDDLVRCAALDGTIGEACSCSIYEYRPYICRVFEPGSPDCVAVRGIELP